jgi:hypothetical protein
VARWCGVFSSPCSYINPLLASIPSSSTQLTTVSRHHQPNPMCVGFLQNLRLYSRCAAAPLLQKDDDRSVTVRCLLLSSLGNGVMSVLCSLLQNKSFMPYVRFFLSSEDHARIHRMVCGFLLSWLRNDLLRIVCLFVSKTARATVSGCASLLETACVGVHWVV